VEGGEKKVFKPQLHGREHLHALAWLAELSAGNKELLRAFELNAFGIPYKSILKQKRKNVQAALDIYGFENELNFQKRWIKESVLIFEKSFGSKAKSFIPPAYIWHSNLHKTLVENKIKCLQGIKLQYQPKSKKEGYLKKPHHIGEVDAKTGLVFFPRNAFFEPSFSPDKDWVNVTMAGIDNAFSNKQPAIIGSHRVNFVGRLNEKHRDRNLAMFGDLLKQIVIKYPDVEFINSGELVDYFKN
jgi:hypothetical protein